MCSLRSHGRGLSPKKFLLTYLVCLRRAGLKCHPSLDCEGSPSGMFCFQCRGRKPRLGEPVGA